MPDPSLRVVRERLLQAGIAPRHVRRYVTELREHLADLLARERAAGHSGPDAAARAHRALGNDAQLVQAMLDSGAPRSLCARAPWAVFVLLPVLTLLLVIAALMVWAMGYLAPYRALSAAAVPEHVRTIGAALTVFGSYLIGPALAACCIIVALRQRLASAWVWAGLVLIAMVSGPLGVNIQFLPGEGGIRGAAALRVYDQGAVDTAATWTMIALRTATLFALSAFAYAMLRRKREAAGAAAD